jgi:hypothetical protein
MSYFLSASRTASRQVGHVPSVCSAVYGSRGHDPSNQRHSAASRLFFTRHSGHHRTANGFAKRMMWCVHPRQSWQSTAVQVPSPTGCGSSSLENHGRRSRNLMASSSQRRAHPTPNVTPSEAWLDVTTPTVVGSDRPPPGRTYYRSQRWRCSANSARRGRRSSTQRRIPRLRPSRRQRRG